MNFESGLDSAAICVQSMEQNSSYSLWKIKYLVHNILTKVPISYSYARLWIGEGHLKADDPSKKGQGERKPNLGHFKEMLKDEEEGQTMLKERKSMLSAYVL